MKRILFPVVALSLLGSAPAYAVCANPLGAVGNSETIDFGSSLALAAPGSASCSFTSTIAVPTGYYGVFKADSRGFSNISGSETSTNTLTGTGTFAGQSSSKTITSADDGDMSFTGYYATGLTSGNTAFTGTATSSTTGSDDAYDGVDLLMAYTSLAQQEDSFNMVGLQQLGIATHLDETAGLLTGSNQPLEGQDEVGIIGGVGSYTLGVTGRYNLAEGFSLLGGVSIVSLGVPGASATGVLGAGALRFVQPGDAEIRFMGEAGVQLAGLGLSFSRHYEDGTKAGTDATGSGTGGLGSVYVKGGALWAPVPDSSVLFSVTLKQSALGIGSLVENQPDTSPNLFAADLSGTSQTFTTVKAGADWTTKLQSNVDLTASLALGAAIGSGASGDVFGVGTVSGAPQSTIFAEYGLRLGWDFTSTSRVDGFIAGSTGTGIGTHAQIGAAYHMSF